MATVSDLSGNSPVGSVSSLRNESQVDARIADADGDFVNVSDGNLLDVRPIIATGAVARTSITCATTAPSGVDIWDSATGAKLVVVKNRSTPPATLLPAFVGWSTTVSDADVLTALAAAAAGAADGTEFSNQDEITISNYPIVIAWDGTDAGKIRRVAAQTLTGGTTHQPSLFIVY